MKLEIGSGRSPHAGYKTVDVEEYAKPDYLGDFRTMSFSDIEEIRGHHILEHFSRQEAIKVLKLWHSWLKPEGILILETPDLKGICERFVNPKFLADRNWLCRHLYGSQEADWAYHKDGWWDDKYREVFPQIGFEITLIKSKTSKVIIKKEGGKERHVLPNILIIAKKI